MSGSIEPHTVCSEGPTVPMLAAEPKVAPLAQDGERADRIVVIRVPELRARPERTAGSGRDARAAQEIDLVLTSGKGDIVIREITNIELLQWNDQLVSSRRRLFGRQSRIHSRAVSGCRRH